MAIDRNILLVVPITGLLCLSPSSVHGQTKRPSNAVGILDPAASAPTAQNTERAVFLPIPHMRQEPNLCVPTSAAMVLEYFGDPRSPRELKVLSRGKDFHSELPFSDFTITWFRDMVLGMQRIAYTWKQYTYMNNSRGFRSGIADVKQSLVHGLPVLVDTALYGGHTFVVAGFDDADAVVYIVDPVIGAPGLRQLTYEEFERVWNSVPVGSNGRAAIFTRRK